MKMNFQLLSIIVLYSSGCAPQRDYSYGGGSRSINSPPLVMANITSQLAQANYQISTVISNDVFTVSFSKRSVHGKVFIDWKTYKPLLEGDLVDDGVNYMVEVNATWFAPGNAVEAVHKVIDKAFNLSKRSL